MDKGKSSARLEDMTIEELELRKQMLEQVLLDRQKELQRVHLMFQVKTLTAKVGLGETQDSELP